MACLIEQKPFSDYAISIDGKNFSWGVKEEEEKKETKSKNKSKKPDEAKVEELDGKEQSKKTVG